MRIGATTAGISRRVTCSESLARRTGQHQVEHSAGTVGIVKSMEALASGRPSRREQFRLGSEPRDTSRELLDRFGDGTSGPGLEGLWVDTPTLPVGLQVREGIDYRLVDEQEVDPDRRDVR